MSYQLTARDYDLKFKRTYVSFREDEKNLPFFVEAIDRGDGIKFVGRILSLEDGNLIWKSKAVLVGSDNLILDFPPVGYINLQSGFSFLLKRKAKKQYKEGLYPEVVDIVDPFLGEREFLKVPSIDSIINKSLLYCVFNNRIFSLKEAINEVVSLNRVAASFDENWCIGIKHNPNRICIMRDEYIVGVLKNDSVFVDKSLMFLREEIEFFGLKVICNE